MLDISRALPTIDGIRTHYAGPLAIAEDFMVFNVAKDKITQRIGVGPDNPWVHTQATRTDKPTFKDDDLNSDFIKNSVIPPCTDAEGGELCY